MPSHLLAIQHITTIWTKASRGGAGAARRNAVPEALLLPHTLAVSQRRLLQSACYSENENFASPRQSVHWQADIVDESIGCAAIQQIETGIRVTFQYNRPCAGLPERGWMNDAFDVSPGQWVQIVYNGRFSDGEGQWRYEKHVVNVGMIEEYNRRIFITTPPAHRYSLMRRLF